MAEGTLMSLSTPVHDVWTFDDLQAIDDDRARRWEIVDGVLVMSPSPDTLHEWVCRGVRQALDAASVGRFAALGPIAIDLAPSYRIPDIVAVADATARSRVNPIPTEDTLLVVEVVSRSSRTADRITKPAQYAAYGIPLFLRVETDPNVTVTVYELAGDVYQQRGPYGAGQVVHLDHPFPVDIAVDDITP